MKRKLLAILFVLTFAFSVLNAAGVGDSAPNFTLNKLGGGTITLSELKGKIVYIFWFGYN